MDGSNSGDLLSLVLGPLGTLVVLIVIIVTGLRGDWMPKKSIDTILTAKDQEREAALAGKDALITEVRLSADRERQNSEAWRRAALEVHTATKEAVDAVTSTAGTRESTP